MQIRQTERQRGDRKEERKEVREEEYQYYAISVIHYFQSNFQIQKCDFLVLKILAF